ncbi:MAG TPA: M13 family metallopeptidase [Vicinamibacterales bacterium]
MKFAVAAVIAVSIVTLGARAQPKPDFLAADMDTSAAPGQDFFEYANGAWLKAHPIPPSEAGWGIGNVVQDELYTKLRTISEDAAKSKAAKETDQRKIGDFWATAMDEQKADALGLKPLQPELDRINAIATVGGALDEAFRLQQIGVHCFFSFGVEQDEKASDMMSVHLAQGGLGLPNRDYYFSAEPGTVKARQAYIVHLGRMFARLGTGEPASASEASAVMNFETELARASRKLQDLRDPEKNYNKMTPAAFTTDDTPSIEWATRLSAWNLRPATVIVGQPEFFSALQRLLNTTPVSVLKDYLRFHLVSAYASTLGKAVDDEHFDFYGRVLSGQKEQRPRWKRALDAENGAMGMILGRIFVNAYFPQRTKARYSALVEAIRSAYKDRIEQLDWMSPATKAKALEKLASMTKKVGYPDKWKDYSALQIGRESYCQNMMNAARWRFNDNVRKFGKPVDRSEWDMTPQTYNAYYNPSNNEIVLPAAIFAMPGVSDDDADDAVVYGYAGASTIGHEMTHGFDDEGRQFDAEGNLHDWWTKDDAQQFNARAQVMVKQFNAYEPIPGLHINGNATLGENIADYGGLLLGLDAFKKTAQYKSGQKIAGLTPLQRYFLGYAYGWLDQQREQTLRRNLLSDVHAPAKWRVIGPLSNITAFDQAFGITEGQPMWRPEDQHVRIW